MICQLLQKVSMSYDTFNAIIYGSLHDSARKKVGDIDLSLEPEKFLSRIVDKLGKAENCSVRSEKFWSLQPYKNEGLLDFYDRVASNGRLAKMDTSAVWIKFISALPAATDTTLSNIIRGYVNRHKKYPTDAHSFLKKALHGRDKVPL